LPSAPQLPRAIQGGSGEPPLPDPRKARLQYEIIAYGTRNLERQYQLRLVNIPIALYPATRREELKFRLLRRSDLIP